MTYLRIILIGYRASGKTSAAKALAKQLGWRWVDTDVEIADADGRELAEIFKAEGEPEFRRRETEVLRRAVKAENVVIATGGGIILAEENRNLLTRAGPVVWLTASADVIRERLTADAQTSANRPALSGHDPVSEVDAVLASRLALYETTANYDVATGGLTPQEVAEEILSQISGND